MYLNTPKLFLGKKRLHETVFIIEIIYLKLHESQNYFYLKFTALRFELSVNVFLRKKNTETSSEMID